MSDGPTTGTRDSDEQALLARAIEALQPPPPPPSIDHVWEAMESTPRRRRSVFAAVALAAAVLVAGVTALFSVLRHDEGNSTVAATSIRLMDPAAVHVFRGDAEVDAGRVRLGDRVQATRATSLSLGARLTAELDADACLELVAENEIRQPTGRVRYEVAHSDHALLTVTVPTLIVTDVGTTFSLDVTPGVERDHRDTRVLLCVESGWVTVEYRSAWQTLWTGQGLAFEGGVPTGPAWALSARPTLSLDVDTPSPTTSAPTDFRVTLTNPTDGWIPLPVRDSARTPLWIEVKGPDGSVRPIRVTEDRIVAEPGSSAAGRAIPPRGRVSVRVRFDSAFASPGTYRLRAVFRATDAVESPASPDITVTVR